MGGLSATRHVAAARQRDAFQHLFILVRHVVSGYNRSCAISYLIREFDFGGR